MTTSHLMTSYSPLPVRFTKGRGVWLEDDQGDQYLDALSGIAVCGLGHVHPDIAAAISDQACTLVHTSNVYQIDLQEKLADRLCALSSMEKVFFGNSGAEANEAAIKLARLHGRNKDIDVPTIVVMEGSFHGRTMATLSATGNPNVRANFQPLVESFVHIPYGDIDALTSLAKENKNIVAVLCEPVQGEGGVNIPADGFLSKIRELCDQNDWLMMLDEIQTGMGRTGKWFAFQHEKIIPDVMTLAKALGNGVPIGACLAKGKAASLFTPGTHGSTFGGNPLACRAGIAVIDVLQANNLVDQAQKRGQYLLTQFQKSLSELQEVVDIRGKGLMIGIELDRPCVELVKQALDQKLLINVTAGNTIRLLPPLIICEAECDQIVDILTPLIRSFLKQ
ncbi:MAG: aspartate aminotransferase family protein [Gammaproteobacteria bacterium]